MAHCYTLCHCSPYTENCSSSQFPFLTLETSFFTDFSTKTSCLLASICTLCHIEILNSQNALSAKSEKMSSTLGRENKRKKVSKDIQYGIIHNTLIDIFDLPSI